MVTTPVLYGTNKNFQYLHENEILEIQMIIQKETEKRERCYKVNVVMFCV